MISCLNRDQKNLYKQYSGLSKNIVHASVLHDKKISAREKIWKLISNEGVWGLSISKQYSGSELSWQECIVALDGFFSHGSNVKCLTLFITQVSSLDFISKYGTESVKKRYLPRLIREDNKFIAREVGLFTLYDLINFERLFYEFFRPGMFIN